MQLRVARLCLDCDEVHDQYRCPVCASDHFTYLSRWIPVPERRVRPRAAPPPPPELDVYRRVVDPPPRKRRLLSRALVGLGAAGVMGLFLGGQRARTRDGDVAQPDDE
ncbi:MAG TPA: hypothetical protein PLH72_15815 [Vicinamibacterales bacterium]|nr:hypothetical protein [Vicinamibacterales bacterium]